MTDAKPQAPRRTAKYLRRQEDILRAAVSVLNEKGVRGMSRANVAERFGMVATAVAYYFSSKEELAAACFKRGIAAYARLVASAAEASTSEDRLAQLIGGVFELRRRVALGQADEIAMFDDIRALADQSVMTDYVRLFQGVRSLIEPGRVGDAERRPLNARTHLVLQQLMWLPVWLPAHDAETYPRVAERFIQILLDGLGAAPRPWSPQKLTVEPAFSDGDSAREIFLRAATQLITEQGYLGASVDKIAARLDLTKGAFYHHLDAKDDLVVTCFERTLEVIRRTQHAADKADGDGRDRLTAALASLVDRQLTGDAPLLRPATTSLPPAARQSLMAEFDRRTVHFGSMISDGIADGSLRAVDGQIAAQMVTATVNASAELTDWLPDTPAERSAEYLLRPLFEGVTARGTQT